MLEKIGTDGFEMLSKPDSSVLHYVRERLKNNGELIYYEIGVGIGATVLPVAEMMDNRGRIFLFSREKEVRELARDLAMKGWVNVDDSWGSPMNTYSGYHFELARGFLQRKLPQFDIAYIDGGHVFHLDAPAACVLKELCKPGGAMIFDDWNWNLKNSPSMNPVTRPATAVEYDQLQIDTCHVPLVCKTIMDTDPRFSFLGLNGNTAVYVRRETE